jgi:hypothetical protein
MRRVLIVVLFGLAALAGIAGTAAATGAGSSSVENTTARITFT